MHTCVLSKGKVTVRLKTRFCFLPYSCLAGLGDKTPDKDSSYQDYEDPGCGWGKAEHTWTCTQRHVVTDRTHTRAHPRTHAHRPTHGSETGSLQPLNEKHAPGRYDSTLLDNQIQQLPSPTETSAHWYWRSHIPPLCAMLEVI